MNRARAEALSLLTSEAVRTRAHALLALGLRDELLHFRIDLDRLETAADLVAETTRAAYPSLEVPLHSRWRHFEFQGVDRWAALAGARSWSVEEAARAAFDLAIVSVLLDAGAGTRWTYHDRMSGATVGRSEGLALATLTMFEDGAFSADPSDPLRVDACRAARSSGEKFRRGLQINDANPLVGVEGRISQLRRLGQVVAEHPEIFGQHDKPRPGGLYDALAAGFERADHPGAGDPFGTASPFDANLAIAPDACGRSVGRLLAAPAAADKGYDRWLGAVAQASAVACLFADRAAAMGRLRRDRRRRPHWPCGIPQWRAVRGHGRSQLARSRRCDARSRRGIAAGGRMARADRRAARRAGRQSTPSAEFGCAAFPLAKLLQGGTWAAGRALAGKLRADGSPPIRVISDGSVF